VGLEPTTSWTTTMRLASVKTPRRSHGFAGLRGVSYSSTRREIPADSARFVGVWAENADLCPMGDKRSHPAGLRLPSLVNRLFIAYGEPRWKLDLHRRC
jgi:hypothetical protein